MKNTDVSWRSKIGGRQFRSIFANKRVIQSTQFGDLVSVVLIIILLMIGNVELNPGPTIENLTFRIVQSEKEKLCNYSTNHRLVNSVWGKLCETLLQDNTLQKRKFMKNFYERLSFACQESCMDICYYQIQVAIEHLNLSMTSPGNYRHISSAWGKLSQHILSLNNFDTRQFINEMYSLCKEVGPATDHEPFNPPNTRLRSLKNKLLLGKRTSCKKQGLPQLLSTSQIKQSLGEHESLGQPLLQNLAEPLLPNLAEQLVDSIRNIFISQEPIQNETIQPTTLTNPIIDIMATEFQKSVFQFTSVVCSFCDKKIYPSLSHSLQLGPQFISILKEFGETRFVPEQVVKLCSRCDNIAKKGQGDKKISPQALCNKLALPDSPTVILALSKSEAALIRQVKCYLKIIMLNRGRGQAALQGMAVFFPLEVEEVTEQLPLTADKSDVIIVTESSEKSKHLKNYEVRPAVVIEALRWLKDNNPFYKNIEILLRTSADLQPVHVQVPVEDVQMEDNMFCDEISYVEIREGIKILRGTIHQGNSIYRENRGKQCTAMCASFITHAHMENPISWVRSTLDIVLNKGNALYSERRARAVALAQGNAAIIPTGNSIGDNFILEIDYLKSSQVMGSFQYFDNYKVILTEHTTEQYSGYLNKFLGPHLNRLNTELNKFILSPHNAAILTANCYSMALYKTQGELYYFDSHSRGRNGSSSKDDNGKACVLKFTDLTTASSFLSRTIHNCVQPKGPPAKGTNQSMNFIFTITPITAERVLDDNAEDNFDIDNGGERQESQLCPSPRKKQPRLDVSEGEMNWEAFELIDEEENVNEDENNTDTVTKNQAYIAANVARQFEKQQDMDCVVADDDFVEPEYEGFDPANVQLRRKDKPPINPSIEDNLDLLAFPHLYPHGINGISAERKIYASPLDVYQQRLMSSMERFATDREFLFYALSSCDSHRAIQRIGVLGQARNEEGHDLEGAGVENPHLFMSAIRGSLSYWKKYTGDLIAMIKTIGTPTFFFTFSYDDLNSFDLVNALYKAKNGYNSSDIDPQIIPYEDRKALLNDYPIVAARHFSMRVTKFLSLIKKHSLEIFGRELADYSLRIEFQSRGSPHVHMLIWLQNAPEWNTPEGLEFLDRNISCSLNTPYKDTVLKYQKHRHTNTCFKNNNRNCRFSFPQPPSENSEILGDEEIQRNRGKFCRLKRTEEEEMINNYHPTLLQILKCNVDIQPVTGSCAIAYYIAKYISKSEPQSIQQEIQTAMNKIKESSQSYFTKMVRIAMQIMRRRQVSAQEAAFRLCHLYLRKSSRTTVFLPTFRKEDRIRMMKKETLRDDIPQFCTNIIDRYIARPDTPEFNNICLFEFASWYLPATIPKNSNVNDDDVEEFEDPIETIIGTKKWKLKDSRGYIQKRKRAAVVKSPNFNPISDRENYYYSLILMYYPFREENFLGNLSAENAFQTLHSCFRNSTNDPCIHPELALQIDQALLRIVDFTEDEATQMNLDDNLNLDYVEHDEPNPEPIAFPIQNNPNILQEISTAVARLNSEQRDIFNTFHSAVQSILNKTPDSEPLRLIINGEGGTGKSFLIGLLRNYIRNTLGADSLIIAAPTGKAAHAISGLTLHRAWSLPIELNSIGKMHKLGAKKLHEMRNTFRNVKFIIIDEMSLINYQTLRMIHLRLSEIFENDAPFANLNICLLGDLLQMKPPRGTHIFKQPSYLSAEIHLWRLFKFTELTINQRQTGGFEDPLLGICRRLRVGELTAADIENLQSKILDPTKENYREQMAKFDDSLWAFPTKKLAAQHNLFKRNQMRMNETTMFTMNALDTFADAGPRYGQKCPNNIAYTDDNKTAGLPSQLVLGVGSRVMMRRNVDVQSGKVNGALGTVEDFQWRVGRNQITPGELPAKIKIKFDHLETSEWIDTCTADFYGKKNIRIMRRMLPFVESFGINLHKLQGITADKIVVDLSKKLFAKGMAYVAISRVRTFNGLGISRLDVSKLIRTEHFSPCDEEALEELNRLRQLGP